MTKQEIEKSIDEFLKVLVYEAQFLSFQKKLLHGIRDPELRLFADVELKKIKLSIKNGQYRNSPISYKQKYKNKKTEPAQRKVEPRVNKKNIPTKIKAKIDTIPSTKDVVFNFKNHTYRDLVHKIDVQILFIERLLTTKGINEKLDLNSPISESVWNIIKDFVINKLKLIEATKRKEAVKEYPIFKKNISSAPLKQYVGGNFGKLIFTGKIH